MVIKTGMSMLTAPFGATGTYPGDIERRKASAEGINPTSNMVIANGFLTETS